MGTILMIDTKKCRSDFPLLKRKVNGKRIVYLDSAATSLKPQSVIDAVTSYYTDCTANVFRGIYKISEEATQKYEDGRSMVAKLVGATSDQIVFVRNTSEALNLIAYSYFYPRITPQSSVVTTIMEHHSNFVPWQQMAMEKNAQFRIWYCDADGVLDLSEIKNLVDTNTVLFTFTAVSNVLGTINPVKEIVAEVKKINPGCLVVVDAAQAVPHMPVDVRDWGADAVAFSSHKMLGPSGAGALWATKKMLADMKPFMYGGDMIREVHEKETMFQEPPHKFEAGTPFIEGAFGFGRAAQYLMEAGMGNVRDHEKKITEYALGKLSEIKGLTVFGPKVLEKKAGVIAFRVDGVHPHDVAQVLDEEAVCIRVGYHCAMPLHEYLKIGPTCRASFSIYNDTDDIDALVSGLKNVQKMFS